ncbi:LysM peptidoglycan-binding domain-containing protein [Bacillus sp. FJAT-42376]|uniref:LysM peptidoglycan-binding domain-containing protein n=1 Tax=Bacillus sp. FJAT-42376 TaxID=2014076 RepID=UPI000F4D7D3D|nr:M23 family metallopeptidase [Bacillus sp. FJAT-42376]AZB44109.1 LysM peptidoglycan-binding domain-containing protein [Bacillus sp. FJAT-42376]
MKRTYVPVMLAAAFSAVSITLPAAAETVTIQEGDTLSQLADSYHMSLQEIKQLNGLTSDLIYSGQILKTDADGNRVKGASIHTVQNGETLSGIAMEYKMSTASLKSLNGLQTDVIYAGQRLEVQADEAPSSLDSGQFPLKKGTYDPFDDTWGKSREYGGARVHEGTDIMTEEGTPVYAATDGSISRKGWNELGGWRLTVNTPDGFNVYYAHLSKYADGLEPGGSIKKGQLIGYAGNSGYGPEGTTGKFVSHLHFGLYDSSFKAINPYPYLTQWEEK